MAHDRASAIPDSATRSTAQTAPDTAASSTLPPGHRGSDLRVSIDSESGDGVDSVPEFVAFSFLLTLFIAAATAFVGGFAAVSIFMDSGCLRMLVATLGWGVAMVAGLIVGLLVGAGFGGLGAFSMIGLFGSGFLYIVAWQQGHQRAQQLPDADRLTWKRTLTGGALIGTGAGSVANLARAAGALFKGGGSFGGGGASGAFGGTQAAATSGAVALGTANASDTFSDEASGDADRRTELAAADSPTERPTTPSTGWHSWMRAAAEQWRRLRWYHGVAFVLVGVIFLPVGMGIAAIMQNGYLLLGLVGAGILIVVLYRSSRSAPLMAEPDSTQSFEGGSVSDQW